MLLAFDLIENDVLDGRVLISLSLSFERLSGLFWHRFLVTLLIKNRNLISLLNHHMLRDTTRGPLSLTSSKSQLICMGKLVFYVSI
jgi:hypothetical protein